MKQYESAVSVVYRRQSVLVIDEVGTSNQWLNIPFRKFAIINSVYNSRNKFAFVDVGNFIKATTRFYSCVCCHIITFLTVVPLPD